MPKKSKEFLTLIFSALMLFAVGISLLHEAHAEEPGLQTKSLTVLNDVLGLNTDLYVTSKSSERNREFLSSPQKETDMQLSSAQSTLRVTCSYVKETLKIVYLSDIEGELQLKQPADNTVDTAKGLLERYQNYSDAAIYGEFASMLDDVDENVDETKYAENVKLEVSGSDQNRVSYMWTYVDDNGVLAERKNVILVFEKGSFKGFFNNWPLYTISKTECKFSAEQATELAIEASKNFSYPATLENGTEVMISGFSIAPESLGYAKLIYVNSVEQSFARGGDPYRMYLAWYVPLGFDKFYPGDVSGLTVILWADTGEICGMDRVIIDRGFGSSVSEQTIESKEVVVQSYKQLTDSTQAIRIAAVVSLVFVSLVTGKTVMSTVSRKHACRFLGLILCALVVFSIFFMSLPNVSADLESGVSRVYGIRAQESHGYANTTADTYEWLATRDICNFIGNATSAAGYETFNLCGEGTINTDVVNNAGSDEQNYSHTIVFHAGHFSEMNRAYQDNYGNPIRAIDISAQTGLGKHFFVFLWVCVQAESNTDVNGTAAAWLNRDGSSGRPFLSADGFANPDPMGQCYISFYGFSPMLSTYVNESNGYYYTFADFGSPYPCSKFIELFYDYALDEELSIHDSLDQASEEFFGCDYSNSVLNTGYDSWWPGGEWDGLKEWLTEPGYWPRDFKNRTGVDDWTKNRDLNRMRVFGDSSIKLTAPPEMVSLDITGRDDEDELFEGNVWIDDYFVGHPDMEIRVTRGEHTISAANSIAYTSHSFKVNGQTYVFSSPYDFTQNSTVEITWYYNPGWNPFPPPEMEIRVGNEESEGGTVEPEGIVNLRYYPYENVTITATPDYWYMVDYWAIDEDYENPLEPDNPLTIPAEPCLVEVFFTDRPPENYSLTISAGDHGTTTPSPGPHWYDEGTNVYVTANPDTSYLLNYWLLDNETAGSNNPICIPMYGNHDLHAVFREALYYDLTIECGENGETEPEEDVYEDLIEGTVVNVTATPDSGFCVYWLLDEDLYSWDTSVTVTMYADHTLEACFTDDFEEFGYNEIFEEEEDVNEVIRGQAFVCPVDGAAVSVTVAVYSVVPGAYVRCAIYDGGLDFVGETEISLVVGDYEPEWQTLEFADPKPELGAECEYVLVVSAVNSPYPIYVAYDYAQDDDGVEMAYEFDWWIEYDVIYGFEYPEELGYPATSTYEIFSIYCTIMPFPET